MKRLFALLLAAALLAGCTSAAPTESGAELLETTLPTQEPTETTPEPTSVPTEPPATVPPAPTEPDDSYTIKVTDPDKAIYAGPSFLEEWAAAFGEAGVFTIVEEATDRDGNLWGKLKSGIGWTCLTEPPKAPIYAAYAGEDFFGHYAYYCDETEYVTDMAFRTDQTLKDVQFTLLRWDEDYAVDTVLYEIDTMTADQTFLAAVVFWGDMTTYGISFRDEAGNDRRYALTISGKDGSLLCFEY